MIPWKGNIICRLSKKDSNTAIGHALDGIKFIHDYESCCLLAKEAGIEIDKITECSNVPGYRLLRLRAHDTLRKSAGIEMSTKIKSFEDNWKFF